MKKLAKTKSKEPPRRLKGNYNLRKRNNTDNMYNRYGPGNKLLFLFFAVKGFDFWDYHLYCR